MFLNCGVGRRLLRVPWTARRSNQSILKEISPEYSLEGLMVKLKLQYFGHLMWRTDSFEKTLMLGKIEGERRRGQQRIIWLDGITDSKDMSLSKLWDWWWTGRPGMLQSMWSQSRTRLSNWTEQTIFKYLNHTKQGMMVILRGIEEHKRADLSSPYQTLEHTMWNGKWNHWNNLN